MIKAFLKLYSIIPTFNDHKENNMGKGENAGHQHFLPSHIVFYRYHNGFFVSVTFSFIVCKCFKFGLVQNFVVWYTVTIKPPDDKILDSSKMKQIADDILKCI